MLRNQTDLLPLLQVLEIALGDHIQTYELVCEVSGLILMQALSLLIL